jgi:hypothetical protein
MEKICNKCQVNKHLNLYGKDRRNKDGLQGICNDCRKIIKQAARSERMAGRNIIPVARKTCNKCQANKPSDQFFKDAGLSDGRATICKECKSKSCGEWRIKNRDYYNAAMRRYRKINYIRDRLYRYKLTLEQYEKMLKDQNELCKICSKGPPKNRPLVIDHCHITNKVRSLLCYSCNRNLHAIETKAFYHKALAYLKSHEIN